MHRKNKLDAAAIFLLVLTAILLLANVGLAFVLMNQSRSSIQTLIQYRMLDVSNTAADMIDGDDLGRIQASDKGTPAYDNILKTLTYFQDNIELKYIYCIRDMGDNKFAFTIDPTVDDPGEFGEPIVYTDALYNASLGTPSVDQTPYEDKWGRFYSAYSPVFDSTGKVSGIVAVDFDAEWYENQLAKQATTTVTMGAVSLIIGAIIVIVMTSRTRKDLRLVRKQAYADGLTDTKNNTAFLEEIKELDDMIEAGVAEFSVAVFDLNGLKNINDNFGHASGNAALTDAASVLVTVFGDDNVYRTGGDEFIVIRRSDTEEDIKKLFSDLDKEFAVLNADEKTYPRPLSLSKGCAEFTKDEDSSCKEVLKRADKMMYADKAEFYMKNGDRRKR